MLRLIIADDEKIIRETICALIDWNSLGIEVVGVCKNGLEAYDMIIDEYPDIVLTDIKMPGFSGLELIRRLTQTHEDIQFIILSGYREFDFAMEAMRYGVKHYLLKPCNERQIIDTVEKVKKVCYQQKEQKLQDKTQRDFSAGFRKNLMRSIITEGLLSRAELSQLTAFYENYLDFTGTSYHLCYFYYLEEANVMECTKKLYDYLKEYLPAVSCCFLYINNILILIMENCRASYEEFDNFAKGLNFQQQTIGIEYQRIEYQSLIGLLQLLVEKLKRYDMIYFIEDTLKIPIYNYDPCLQKLHRIIEKLASGKGDIQQVKQELKSILSSIQDEEFLKILITNILMTPNVLNNLDGVPTLPELLNDINTSSNPKEVYRRFIDLIDSIRPLNTFASVAYKPFIRNIFTFVEEQLSDPSLSLKWIAEHYLYMNVDYVSKQFVKQTGKRFSQYLNEVRIEKAKSLLKNCRTDKIYLVAEQVGCGNNPQYFSQLFKKYTGMKPSDYVKKYGNTFSDSYSYK